MNLGDRMKMYENVNRNHLMRRMPVIIRIDGKAFHTYTRKFDKPFSHTLNRAMAETTRFLCENIQGVQLGYTQSDEINLLLTDYTTYKTEAWFDNNIQKMVSISSSLATGYFNSIMDNEEYGIANFDARVFNLSKEEVCNYFIWRQRDATRNSIQGLAQSLFSHKEEIQGVSNNELQNKMLIEKDVNWNNLSTWKKRGTVVYKSFCGWNIKFNPPIFSKKREYINDRVYVGKEGN